MKKKKKKNDKEKNIFSARIREKLPISSSIHIDLEHQNHACCNTFGYLLLPVFNTDHPIVACAYERKVVT